MVVPDDLADHIIIARVLAGDVDAFGVLVRRYQDNYMRFAVRMTGTATDAEDALQSAFVRAYRHLGRCRDPERFGAWFHRIVVNECRTLAMNRVRREQRFTNDLADVHTVVEPEVGSQNLDDLQVALEALPPAQREAVLLRYAEDLNYDEMAEVTGVGVSALKMRVKRGVERMHDLLKGAYHAK